MNFHSIFVHPPRLIQRLLNRMLWRVNTQRKVLYLTFDDGPIPFITPWVVETLNRYNAKATFFCVGDNVRKYPEVLDRIIESGHSIGNHTYHHLNGWQTDNSRYVDNVSKAEMFIHTDLFRPPYGKISRWQRKALNNRYHIVMWDVLSCDFDRKINGEQCFQNVLQHASSGSIVVFHDSEKAWQNLQYALPRTLEYFSRQGYTFEAITPQLAKAVNF